VLGLVGVATAPGLVAGSAAYADTAAPVVSGTNWYWSGSDGPASTTPVGAGPFAAPAQASGIPDGDLGVAYTNDVDKVAALDFLLAAIPEGASVSKFAVTVPLDSTASNLAAGTPELVACSAIEQFAPADGPSPLSKQPAQAFNVCVDGKPNADATAWVFDLAPIADDWANGAPANGVVLRPKAGSTTSFNYAFLGRNAIKVAAEFTPAATTPAAPPVSPADAGAGIAQPPTGFTGDSGSAPVGAISPATAPITAPLPEAPAAPAVAPLAPAAAPVVAAPVAESLRPDRSFWLYALGLGGLVVLAGLVLGDPMEPVAVDARRRRFAEVIRARAAARAAATAPVTPEPARTPRARPA
jgi:hypothetical protein